MIPPIILAGAGIVIGKILYDALKKEEKCEMSCFDPENMYRNFLLNSETQISNVVLRQRTTRSINRMIRDAKGFKIGKSGNPVNRIKTYGDYKSMFLMASSNSEEVISELESYYTNMYISHDKNDNQRAGSAGRAKSFDGDFYLYLVLR